MNSSSHEDSVDMISCKSDCTHCVQREREENAKALTEAIEEKECIYDGREFEKKMQRI